jgi:uncharacterized membrane protein
MPLAQTLTPFLSPESLAALAPNLSVTVPLLLVCLGVLIAIPVGAARGKLHVPGYVGLAFLAFALGLVLGRISGMRSITGTIAGLGLSILCFLLMAIAVGSVLALFFYRHPPEA